MSQTHPFPSAEHPPDPIREIAVTAARAAEAKGGRDPVVLHVAEVLALCELFVITSGTNDRQVRAICDDVEARVHDAGGPKPLRIEGLADLRWVLMDYGDVVVHVFADEDRDFYDLERLWADVPRVDWRSARP